MTPNSDMPTPGPDVHSPAASAPPQAPKKKKRRRRVIILTILGLLLAAEGSLRLLAGRYSKFNIFLGAEKEFDPVRRTRWKKDYHVGAFNTNSRGFPGPEFETKKAPGTYRIVCLGDSASVIPPQKSYPAALQDRLRADFPDKKIDVINASCSGYDSRQARSWYEDEVDAIEHDMLIIYLGWNDMGQYNPDGLVFKQQETGYLKAPSALDKLILNIYLLRSIYVVRGFIEQRSAFSTEPLTGDDLTKYSEFYPDHFEKNLVAVIRLAQSRGRRVWMLNHAGLIVESPTPDEQKRIHFPRGMGRRLPKYLALMRAYEAAQQKVSRETGVPIIDVVSHFADPKARVVFSDSAHFDERGSEMFAEIVAGAIRNDIK